MYRVIIEVASVVALVNVDLVSFPFVRAPRLSLVFSVPDFLEDGARRSTAIRKEGFHDPHDSIGSSARALCDVRSEDRIAKCRHFIVICLLVHPKSFIEVLLYYIQHEFEPPSPPLPPLWVQNTTIEGPSHDTEEIPTALPDTIAPVPRRQAH